MGCCFSIVCCGSTPETPPAHLVGTWEGVASDQSKIQMIIDADGNMEWTRTMKGISCSPRQIIAYVKYNHSKFPLTGWNRDVPDEHDYWHTESKLEGTNYAVYPFTRSWKRKVFLFFILHLHIYIINGPMNTKHSFRFPFSCCYSSIIFLFLSIFLQNYKYMYLSIFLRE